MSDESLRTLTHAAFTHPDDAVASERLEAAQARARRGRSSPARTFYLGALAAALAAVARAQLKYPDLRSLCCDLPLEEVRGERDQYFTIELRCPGLTEIPNAGWRRGCGRPVLNVRSTGKSQHWPPFTAVVMFLEIGHQDGYVPDISSYE